MTLVIVILLIAFALLAWRDLKLAALVLVGVLPVYLLRFEILGVPTTALEGMIWILVVLWLARHRLPVTGYRPLRLPLTPLLLAGILSLFVAPDFFSAVGLFKAYLVEPLLLFLLFTNLFTREDLPRVFRALAFSVIALSLVAIIQRFTGLGIPEPWDVSRRVTSLFEYPNALGLFVAPLLAGFPFLHRTRWKWLFATAMAFGLVAISFSETEAAWVAVPLAILSAWTLSESFSRRAVLTVVGLLLVAGLLFFATPFREKLLLADWSGQTRVSQWSETWDMLTSSPERFLLGAGWSGYPTAVAPFHTDTRFEIFQYPHNMLLNTWVELGLLGVLAFLSIICVLARLLWHHRKDPLALTAGAGLLEMLIHGLVDVPYFKNDLAILTWLLIAVAVISARTPKPELHS